MATYLAHIPLGTSQQLSDQSVAETVFANIETVEIDQDGDQIVRVACGDQERASVEAFLTAHTITWIEEE